MMAPGLPDLALKYGITNPTVLALTLSIFLLSFAIGPLSLGPLSEMYGRTWVCPCPVSDTLLLTAIRCYTLATYSSSASIWAALWPPVPALLLFSAFSVRHFFRTYTRLWLKPCRWFRWKCANRLRWWVYQ